MADNAGDDFYTKAKGEDNGTYDDYFSEILSQHFVVTLPQRLPNGAPIVWYKDMLGDRYESSDAPYEATPTLSAGEWGAKAIINSTALSSVNTKLIIEQNTAGDGGGGIGTNGYLKIGSTGPTDLFLKK